jgi:hypothetical protein
MNRNGSMIFIFGRNHLNIEPMVDVNCQRMLVDIEDTKREIDV